MVEPKLSNLSVENVSNKQVDVQSWSEILHFCFFKNSMCMDSIIF